MNRKCKNNFDWFCYIFGNVVLPNRQAKVTDFVKKTYYGYFGVKVRDQDKPFAFHVCCKICVKNLWDYGNGKNRSMPFTIPIVWREEKDLIEDCYFCINSKGINPKNKNHVQFPDVLSVKRPTPPWPDLLTKADGDMEFSSVSKRSDITDVAETDAFKPEENY